MTVLGSEKDEFMVGVSFDFGLGKESVTGDDNGCRV